MRKKRKTKSLDIWKRYGKNVLMLYDYYDDILSEGMGSKVKDLDGNEIIDFSSGQFCSVLGHSNPLFIRSMIKQIERISHTGTHFLSPPVLEASSKISGIAPKGLNKVVLLSTGTEANECALRIAKTFTKKKGVVGFNLGYSGISLAMKSISSKQGKAPDSDKPEVPFSFRIITPHCSKCPFDLIHPSCNIFCLKKSITALGKHSKDIAAFIVEPILSDGGVIVPPRNYFKELKRFAHKIGALLIVDEAQTGFGRTGKWFAIENFGVAPDILVFAKGAGNGFPVSGLITTEKIEERLISSGFSHISSHQSDPISASAVSSVIDIIKNDKLILKAREKGIYLRRKLEDLKKMNPIIKEIRGMGLILGLELDSSAKEIKQSGFKDVAGLGKALEMKLVDRGLYINYTSHTNPVFRILPPLTTKKKEIDKAIEILNGCLSDLKIGKINRKSLIPKNPYSVSILRRWSPKKTLKKILKKGF